MNRGTARTSFGPPTTTSITGRSTDSSPLGPTAFTGAQQTSPTSNRLRSFSREGSAGSQDVASKVQQLCGQLAQFRMGLTVSPRASQLSTTSGVSPRSPANSFGRGGEEEGLTYSSRPDPDRHPSPSSSSLSLGWDAPKLSPTSSPGGTKTAEVSKALQDLLTRVKSMDGGETNGNARRPSPSKSNVSVRTTQSHGSGRGPSQVLSSVAQGNPSPAPSTTTTIPLSAIHLSQSAEGKPLALVKDANGSSQNFFLGRTQSPSHSPPRNPGSLGFSSLEQWVDNSQRGLDDKKDAREILNAVRQSHEAQQEAVRMLLKKEEEKRAQRRKKREEERRKKREKREEEKEKRRKELEKKKEKKAAEVALRTGKKREEIDDDDLSFSFSVDDSSSSDSDSSSGSSWSSSSSSSSSSLPSGLLNAISTTPSIYPLNLANLSRLEKQLELLRAKHQEELKAAAERHQKKGNHDSSESDSGGSPTQSQRKRQNISKKIEHFEKAIAQAIAALNETPDGAADVGLRLDALFAEIEELLPGSTPPAAGPPSPSSAGRLREDDGSFSVGAFRSAPIPSMPFTGPRERRGSGSSSVAKSSVVGLPTVILHPNSAAAPRSLSPSMPSANYMNKSPWNGQLTADPIFATTMSPDGNSSASLGLEKLKTELEKLNTNAQALMKDIQEAGSEKTIEKEICTPISTITNQLESTIDGGGAEKRAEQQAIKKQGRKLPAKAKATYPMRSSSFSSSIPSPSRTARGSVEVHSEAEEAAGPIPLETIRDHLRDLQKEYEMYADSQEGPDRAAFMHWRNQLGQCREDFLRCKATVEEAVRKAGEQRTGVRHSVKRNVLDPLPPRLEALRRHLSHILHDREGVVNLFNRFQEAVWEDDSQLATLQQHVKQQLQQQRGSGERSASGEEPLSKSNSVSSVRSSALLPFPDGSMAGAPFPSIAPDLLQEMQARHEQHKTWILKRKEQLLEIDELVKSIQREQLEEMGFAMPALFDRYSKDVRHEEERLEKAAERASSRLRDVLEELERLHALLEIPEEEILDEEEAEEEEEEEEEEAEEEGEEEKVSEASTEGEPHHRRRKKTTKQTTVHISKHHITKEGGKSHAGTSPACSEQNRRRGSHSSRSPSNQSQLSSLTHFTSHEASEAATITSSSPLQLPTPISVEKLVADHKKEMEELEAKLREQREQHREMLEKEERARREEEERIREAERKAREEKEATERAMEEERRKRMENERKAFEEALRKELEDARKAMEEEKEKRRKQLEEEAKAAEAELARIVKEKEEKRRKQLEEEAKEREAELARASKEKEERRRKQLEEEAKEREAELARASKEKEERRRKQLEEEAKEREAELARASKEKEERRKKEEMERMAEEEERQSAKLAALEAALKAQQEQHRAELERAEKQLEKERAEKREAEWRAQQQRERLEREVMAERMRALEEKLKEEKAQHQRELEEAKKALEQQQKERRQREKELELRSEQAKLEHVKLQEKAARDLQEALQRQEKEHQAKLKAAEEALERERAIQKEREQRLLDQLEEAKRGKDKEKVDELEKALRGQQQDQMKALEAAIHALDAERERHAKETDETMKRLGGDGESGAASLRSSPAVSSRGKSGKKSHSKTASRGKKKEPTFSSTSERESSAHADLSARLVSSLSSSPTESTEDTEQEEEERLRILAGVNPLKESLKFDGPLEMSSPKHSPMSPQRRDLYEKKLRRLEAELETERDLQETRESNLKKNVEKMEKTGFRSRAHALKKELAELCVAHAKVLAEKEDAIRMLRARLGLKEEDGKQRSTSMPSGGGGLAKLKSSGSLVLTGSVGRMPSMYPITPLLSVDGEGLGLPGSLLLERSASGSPTTSSSFPSSPHPPAAGGLAAGRSYFEKAPVGGKRRPPMHAPTSLAYADPGKRTPKGAGVASSEGLLFPKPPGGPHHGGRIGSGGEEKAALLAARRKQHLPTHGHPTSDARKGEEDEGEEDRITSGILRQKLNDLQHGFQAELDEQREAVQRQLDELRAKHAEELGKLNALLQSDESKEAAADKQRKEELQRLQVSVDATNEKLRQAQALLDQLNQGGSKVDPNHMSVQKAPPAGKASPYDLPVDGSRRRQDKKRKGQGTLSRSISTSTRSRGRSTSCSISSSAISGASLSHDTPRHGQKGKAKFPRKPSAVADGSGVLLYPSSPAKVGKDGKKRFHRGHLLAPVSTTGATHLPPPPSEEGKEKSHRPHHQHHHHHGGDRRPSLPSLLLSASSSSSSYAMSVSSTPVRTAGGEGEPSRRHHEGLSPDSKSHARRTSGGAATRWRPRSHAVERKRRPSKRAVAKQHLSRAGVSSIDPSTASSVLLMAGPTSGVEGMGGGLPSLSSVAAAQAVAEMSQDKEPRMHTCHHPHAEKRGKKKGTRGASHRHSTRGNHGSPGTKDDSLSLLSLEDGKEPESGRMPFSSAEKPRKRSSKRIPEEDDLKDSDRERAHPSRAKSMASQRKRSIAPSTSVASSARAPRRVVPAVPGGGGTKSRKGSRFRPPRASKASIADSSPLSSRFIEGGGITVLHSAVASPDASAVPMQLSPGTSHYTFVVSPTKRIPYSAHKDGSSPTNHLLSTSTRIRIPMSNSKGVVPTPAGSDLSQASILQLPCSSSVRSDQPSSTFREYRSSITVGGAGGGVVVSSSSPRDYTPEIREKAGVYTVVEGARWLSDMYKKEPMYSKKTGNSLDELGSIELLAPHRKRKHKAHRIPSPLFSGSREADEGIPLPQRFHRESPALRSISEGRRGRSDGRNSSVHSDFVTPISRRDAQKRASRVRPATP